MNQKIESLLSNVDDIVDVQVYGRVIAVQGLLIECSGLQNAVSMGSRCKIITRSGKEVLCEVVGLRNKISMLMPFYSIEGVGVGCKVLLDKEEFIIYPDESWKGRIINALGEPIDDKGPLKRGKVGYHLKASPPPAHKRKAVGGKIDLGIRAINTFLTCCKGQRMGVFSGSGIGKSMLVSMLTKHSEAEIKVIGLIGERGRELHEFIYDYLGEEGLKKAVIIAATSDESALMRRQSAYMTMSVAEYFRDSGKDVLCLMDSITRFAMAQREIGLSVGEPPATKGYTPTTFVEMPKLLERAGPGVCSGSITGLFTVLVEGDDHNEPISDAVRGILDGHIVLDRTIAERGRFPAVNILRSVSRTMPKCNTSEENKLVDRARYLLSVYEDMAEMIRLGAYRKGSDKNVDDAIFYFNALEEFLKQDADQGTNLQTCYAMLSELLSKRPNGSAPEGAQENEATPLARA